MGQNQLSSIYRNYIKCLNEQNWQILNRFIHPEVCHNGIHLGVIGYQQMLEQDYIQIPDLYFSIELLVVDPPYVASRLRFHCSPKDRFLNLHIDGKKISFTENVFYEFSDEKIIQVWSILDKTTIESQLDN